jgi:TolA-binding protein
MARPELLRTATRTGEGSSVPQSSIPSGSTLSSEIAAIDQAKRALASGDPAAALRRVDDYDAAFPRGTLAAEATALRIEALARTGRLGDARAELARLRATHPHSPLLENLARLVGE